MTQDTAAWLGEQIDAHDPDMTDDPEAAFRLAEACAAFGGATAQAFGMTLPEAFDGRDELKQRAVAALKRWLPRLDPEGRERMKKLIGEYRLVATQ
ncbi:MAG: hypothetical protein KF773_09565 [Deltaproteobacteria bacterium]|nr:hypothetical protein [Deltaproteobacteria bacterium]MCW5803815.1 hypothetical protein [Deltaproteobacteria bacterium]